MSALQIAHVLEKSRIGKTLQESASDWLETLLASETPAPLLLLGAGCHELHQIANSFHRAAMLLIDREGECGSCDAGSLLKDLQTYGEQPLQAWSGETLLVTGLAQLDNASQTQLMRALHKARLIADGELLLLIARPDMPTNKAVLRQLKTLCPFAVQVPPLYQRSHDIDRQICAFSKTQSSTSAIQLEGFSLEATAHVHRAVLQTQRDSDELFALLQELLTRAQEDRLPLHNGYIVAWPTVRMLEDRWGYRLNQQDELYQAEVQCDFQTRLFSASVEHAASRSGFSKSLIELQCQLLDHIIEELPEHQRNYQGLTSRVDQLQWMGMKLLSQARTQAELRDFFGFGGKGKIPKATAKLKFDQYDLEHYGYRATDPLPWDATSQTRLPSLAAPAANTTPYLTVPTGEAANEAPLVENRKIVTVEGELAETLFWRHQDLFTVLAADPLDCEQIASLMNMNPKQVGSDLEELVAHGFLAKNQNQYALHGDDVYYKHSHSRLRCIEENLMRYLYSAFERPDNSVLDNWFLRLPEEGLPLLRKELLQPFIHNQFLPLSDNETPPAPGEPYNKRMYALMLLGTHRLSPLVHGRLPLEQRILYYFREASLQRADRQQQHQAICMRATQMLNPDQIQTATQHIQSLRKKLRSYLPHGRGNKPNFNITLCFTEVPLAFYRDLEPASIEDPLRYLNNK